jgi:RNA methyltransferase, TrmH family
VKIIRSRDNAFVKQLIALAHSSRERKKAGLTVLDGLHLVRAYVEACGVPRAVVVAESALANREVADFLAELTAKNAAISVLSDALVTEASSLESPAALLAEIETPAPRATPVDADAVLILEDVQDPGNVGSMLRSAAAAGVKEIVLSKTSAFAWSPKVLRAAQGAHFLLNIAEGVDVIDFVQRYRGQSLALVPRAARVGGKPARTIYGCDLKTATAWLIGNEGAGLSDAVLQAATMGVTIPMPGRVESLNAAASAAIAMFEMTRQRAMG